MQSFLMAKNTFEKKNNTSIVASKSEARFFQGPIPEPETLIRYNDAVPGAADRIITMAEQQQQHRFVLEKKAVTATLNRAYLGQIFGFIIGMFCVGVAGYVMNNGHEFGGAVFGVGGIAGLVSVFVIGRKKQNEDLQAKRS